MKNENENNQSEGTLGNFGLPEGYFRKSAHSIVNKIEWQEEHRDFQDLLKLKNVNVFVVPANYFDENEQVLELSQYPNLRVVQNINPFRIPQNYFEQAEISEFERGFKEDQKDCIGFGIIKTIKGENVFIVPPDYFSENESKLEESLNTKPAKVISLFSRRIGFTVAALLLVVMSIWIYKFYSAPAVVEDCATIACLDRQDLVKTKNLERFEDEELYELVDPAALEKKLHSTENTTQKQKHTDSIHDVDSDEELLDGI